MAISDDIISQFVKVTNDRGVQQKETTMYGEIVNDGSRNFVRIDGSDKLAPITTTVEVSPGDRVIVNVKNHMATVTGNTTDPAIGTKRAGALESSITQTAEQIRLEVKDMESNLQSSITQTADSISAVVKNQDEFSEFKQTVEGFAFMNKGGTVKIDGGSINLTGSITWSDLDSTAQGKVNSAQNTANSAASTAGTANSNASSALSSANQALTTVSGWAITANSTTYIDGRMIYSGTIYADALHLGGLLTVYQSLTSNSVGGYLGYDSGFSSEAGIGMRYSSTGPQCVCTNVAARLSYGSDNSFVAGSGGVSVTANNYIHFYFGGTTYYEWRKTYYAPIQSGITLGTAYGKWDTVYASTGTINTSDRNQKNSIEDLPDKYLTMFDQLRERRFKMNDGRSDRYHVGYIAQEVEEAMQLANIDSKEFGGFIKDYDSDGNEIYMLRYGEFNALYSAKIKQLANRVAELEKRVMEG